MSHGEKMEEQKKHIFIRLINSVSAFTIIGVSIYILFAGIELIPTLFLMAALGGHSGAVLFSGSCEGIFEFISRLLEAFIEGVVGFFESIGGN
jgi:hypothetical protein